MRRIGLSRMVNRTVRSAAFRIVLTAFMGCWLVAACAPLRAQPISYGSADNPAEQIQRVWWKREQVLDLMGGLSLIGPQWRGASSLALNLVTIPVTGRLQGTLRAGYHGEYGPDVDEPYDALRLVDFLRYNSPTNTPLHLRAGTVERLQLGTGHVVNFFSSSLAWDERTVGAEGSWRGTIANLDAFTDNLLLNGVTGGRLAFHPLYWARDARLRSATLGANYVTDLATPRAEGPELTAYNVDFTFSAFTPGTVRFMPFVSVAWYTEYGSGLSFGATVESDNFIDLMRFRLRLALYYNGKEFIPGYVGSFYTVSNPYARIVSSLEDENEAIVGVHLADGRGGNDFLTELRILVFDRFEFWHYFRRHYGTQELSEYHLRLFFRTTNRLHLQVGIDRQGLEGFFSIFSDMDDQSALTFRSDYRLAGTFWLFIRARYSFERLDNAADETQRYLVQRRFEPMTGFKFTF